MEFKVTPSFSGIVIGFIICIYYLYRFSFLIIRFNSALVLLFRKPKVQQVMKFLIAAAVAGFGWIYISDWKLTEGEGVAYLVGIFCAIIYQIIKERVDTSKAAKYLTECDACAGKGYLKKIPHKKIMSKYKGIVYEG